tara:strand:+ start:475 stop:2199 length:1725 start_codon:yes stop_codon:yes gene_type:complete
MGMTKQELIQEYVKCHGDTPYALKTYLHTYDNTQQKHVPFDLFPEQKEMVKDFENYDDNIVLKYRQAGVSTATAGWISKKLQFASKESPEKILILANKLDTATEMANKIKGFLRQWPDWINVGFDKDKNSQKHYKLNNGSEVKAVATSVDALRGYTPTILVFDEAAYIESGGNLWAACMASLATGGKVIVISTPNGFDQIYYEVFDQSIRGLNNFKISYLSWYHDPRFTKGLEWIKTTDIVHFLLNRDEYKEEDIVGNVDTEDYQTYMDKGYKPFSHWFEEMCKKLKFDRRKISQELECAFLGSGDNVINSVTMDQLAEHICDPIEKWVGNGLWVWKEPIPEHKYIMGVDVSRGDSEDSSGFVIVDFDEREEVVEYLGKIPPDIVADLANKWANKYNCFVVIDITGGMGVATSRKMLELGYKDFYYDGVKPEEMWKFNPDTKTPGINFNSKRAQIVQSLEEQVRTGFKIRSQRLMNELKTFVFINGRPDHMRGHHDDLIMSLAMALYVAQTSFTQLKKNVSQAKAMLDAWVTDERKFNTPHGKPVFNAGRATSNPLPPSSNDPKDYLWLYSGLK